MTIVITLTTFFEGEAECIAQMLDADKADLVHIRKPGACEGEVENLIRSIPERLRNRLVLHDHHHLAIKHGLHGIHINSRNPEVPAGWTGSVSRSCHSFSELSEWKQRCNYVSLSPIFDSISKRGYNSAFTKEEIAGAANKGIIDNKVMALGGVTFARISEVEAMGFGGAMILGDAWK